MRIAIYIILLISFLPKGFGQISPGELSAPHAHLEGISNCTKCHDLGKSVTNSLCLDCHKEIRSLISQKRGYHSHSSVKNKNCFECHNEHHGRNFNMIRFDEKQFNHSLTSYQLTGKHAVVNCRDCHKKDFIQDPELKKRRNTWLGLKDDCLSCHEDFHQKTLDADCKKCHDMNAFRPASLFDHEKTDYKLRGKHAQVDCKLCHKISTRNGKEFQQFADVPHNDCRSCHNDPHQEALPGSCTQCHDETAFTHFAGKQTFDHTKTKFTLKGKHKTTDCFQCHARTKDPLKVFQDRLNVPENNCVACHEDKHKGKLGTDCIKCHSENSFISMKTMDFFDHSSTDYPLTGKHVGVDCKKCHTERYTVAIDFSACKNCHKDYHSGEFVKDGMSPDCDKCHALDQGFNVTLFTAENHQATRFPLEESHAATPCSACHMNEQKEKSEKKWTFRNLGVACAECHENPHGNRFEREGVTSCERCHDAKSWFPGKFNHDETAFKLEGKHAEIECLACHTTYTENGKTKVEYKIEKFECVDCHR